MRNIFFVGVIRVKRLMRRQVNVSTNAEHDAKRRAGVMDADGFVTSVIARLAATLIICLSVLS